MKSNRKRLYLFSFVLLVICVLFYCGGIYKIVAVNIRIPNKRCGHSFRIITFNINSNDTLSFTTAFQDSLLEEIRRQTPDIICFQELSFENLKKIMPQLDSIYGKCDTLKGDNQLWRLMFYSNLPLRNLKRYHCDGTIETSDFDSLELKEYDQMRKQMSVMSAEFEVQPGKWITLFSGHLRSSAYSTARRSMKEDPNWFKGIPLYYRNYKIGKRIRDYQARNVRRFIDEARAEGKTVIVAGDLNDWCGSTTLNTLMGEGDDALKDAWWEGGNGFGFTYYGWHLRLRLDHILYSDGLELQDVKVIDSNLSDHRPLIARFNIK